MTAELDARDGVGSERSFRALLAVCFVAPLLLFGGLAWYDYGQIISGARANVRSTTRALAEHAEKVLETNQLVLALMTDRVKGMSWHEIANSSSLHEFLTQLTHEMPQLESVFFVSPNGVTAASSRSFPMPAFDVTGRDYFRAAQAGNSGLFVSAPFVGQMSRTTAFTVSRPLDPANPAGGLVAITLSPSYFARFYKAVVDTPLAASAALLRDDGAVLVRYPEDPKYPAATTPRSLITPALQAHLPEGILDGGSNFDRERRLLGFQRIELLPLVATYGVHVEGVLAVWYRHVAILAVLCLILAGALFQASRLAIRRTRMEGRNLRLLVAETERREAAEDALRQLQKIEALGRLTGGIAHDFNNLLTAVMGSLELAQKRTTDPRILRLLGAAMEAAQRGARLTQHMLTFSRQQNVHMRPVCVNDVVRGMEDMLERTLGGEIRVHQALDDALWHAVADATQLEVAILNLVINARDAMPLGGTLSITTANVPAGAPRAPQIPAGEMVCLSVADTGAGMTPEVIRRAVEPFFTTKDVGRGTGLGLSMVHGFVQQTGGELAISSKIGHGTEIRVYLPRAEPEHSEAAQPQGDATARPRLHILVVDDDLGVRTLTAEMLRELGHEVTEVGDGSTAIDRVAAIPDLALAVLDFAMPDMNGGDVARRLTRIRPALPLLFVTGFAEGSALQEWTSRGYPLLSKPFSLDALAGAIEASLSQREPMQTGRTS
ncbi:MAG TPA: ATP-binding protein [Acetobacteraceae bacterium]|jgi:signal transduction histidine kinase/ActR/RegA family two-component response regulator|nr:ATP-binding protein [Acetobacteraceae bacterium]